MKLQRFEDIFVWQKAESLTVKIYTLFADCRDFGFRDQIQRATVSIGNNIAEGFERKGNKEFKRFLYIAKGSCGEVRSMLQLACKLGYIPKPIFNELYFLSVEISKMIYGFIKKL